MARRPRIEIEGGLYHVTTRGNNRQLIFNSNDDHLKLLSLLKLQKARLPFFLYAYCLMPNHVHLLIEQQQDPISRIMHRVLTGYSQYYNRKYKKVGHLFQGRYKAILCQTDKYLGELVRYIHLNPVRAKMVRGPEEYRYSSHRCYIGADEAGMVDIDPVLRHFAAKKKLARQRYDEFVRAGMKLGHREEFYHAESGRILGSEEFVDATIHRIGEIKAGGKKGQMKAGARASERLDLEQLILAVERMSGIPRSEFCSGGKAAATILAKEALIVIAREAGVSTTVLSELTGMNSSAISRRHESGRRRVREEHVTKKLVQQIKKHLWGESHSKK